MKNITKILAVLGLVALTSCDFFLEKPDTTCTVDRDAVFGSKKNAEAALMSCYRNALIHGLPGGRYGWMREEVQKNSAFLPSQAG